MPIPVSVTSRCSCAIEPIRFPSRETTMWPCFVNFMALVMRFVTSWRKPEASPCTLPTVNEFVVQISSIPWTSAEGLNIAATSSVSSAGLKLLVELSDFFLGWFAANRLFTTVSSALPPLSILRAISLCFSGGLFSLSNAAKPRMPFKWLRTSWLKCANPTQ